MENKNLENQKQVKAKVFGEWSIVLWSLIGGFYGVIYMMKENNDALGNLGQSKSFFRWGLLIAFVYYTIMLLVTDDLSLFMTGAMMPALAYIFVYRYQGSAINAHITKGGPTRSFWEGLLIAHMGLILIALQAIVLLSIIPGQRGNDERFDVLYQNTKLLNGSAYEVGDVEVPIVDIMERETVELDNEKNYSKREADSLDLGFKEEIAVKNKITRSEKRNPTGQILGLLFDYPEQWAPISLSSSAGLCAGDNGGYGSKSCDEEVLAMFGNQGSHKHFAVTRSDDYGLPGRGAYWGDLLDPYPYTNIVEACEKRQGCTLFENVNRVLFAKYTQDHTKEDFPGSENKVFTVYVTTMPSGSGYATVALSSVRLDFGPDTDQLFEQLIDSVRF